MRILSRCAHTLSVASGWGIEPGWGGLNPVAGLNSRTEYLDTTAPPPPVFADTQPRRSDEPPDLPPMPAPRPPQDQSTEDPGWDRQPPGSTGRRLTREVDAMPSGNVASAETSPAAPIGWQVGGKAKGAGDDDEHTPAGRVFSAEFPLDGLKRPLI